VHDVPPSDSVSHPSASPKNAIPVVTSQVQSTTDSSLSGSATGPKGTNPGNDADDNAASRPDQITDATAAVHTGELAFAARLTSGEADPASGAANAPAPDPSDPVAQVSTRAQVSARTDQNQEDTATATSSGASPSEVQRGKSDVASLVEQFTKQDTAPLGNSQPGETSPAISAKSDAATEKASPSARMEQWIDPPKTPSSSSRDITIRVPDATERGASVRFVDRGGEIRVSVRTGDAELAQTLRGGLSDFVGRLDHSGIRAEVWRPAAIATPQSDAQNDSKNGSQNQGNQNGAGRNSSGSQSQQDSRQGTNKPRWVEELETSIGTPTAPGNQ
jgi:hypothetical protein